MLKKAADRLAMNIAVNRWRRKTKRLPDIEPNQELVQNAKVFATRRLMHEWIREAYSPEVVAEIGVFEGDHTVEMIESLRPKKMILVDIWKDEDQMKRTIAKVSNYMDVEVYRMDSIQWMKKHGEVDYMYLDTSHRYEQTKRELSVAIDRGIPIIGGHDFDRGVRFPYGVIPAVYETGKELLAITIEWRNYRSFLIKNK